MDGFDYAGLLLYRIHLPSRLSYPYQVMHTHKSLSLQYAAPGPALLPVEHTETTVRSDGISASRH
jgi:hypothetical protein